MAGAPFSGFVKPTISAGEIRAMAVDIPSMFAGVVLFRIVVALFLEEGVDVVLAHSL
jgi:hypothetical protein